MTAGNGCGDNRQQNTPARDATSAPAKGIQNNTPIGRLTPARRLVSAGPLYTTWFLHTRRAGASCSFRLQASQGP